MKLQNVKGFKDYLPKDALKRQIVLEKIKNVFAKFGFDPLETPTLEYAETLQGKYGEEEKLIYKFTTQGGDEVALKYDQTVPLARVVAQYGINGLQQLPTPFKRYQIQSAFRGENTQKGRYREFLQCDADIIGASSTIADTEILALVYEIYKQLNLEVIIKINDRSLISDIPTKYLASIDKLNKIGRDGVLNELGNRGLTTQEATTLLTKVEKLQASDNLKVIINQFIKMSYPEDSLKFDPTLIRGLDYYTGLILEVVLKQNPNSSSLCGGGRWDNMIGKFTGKDQPAVGFAIGVDRTIEAMEERGVLEIPSTNTKVLVTVYSHEDQFVDASINALKELRKSNINSEIWLDIERTEIQRQTKYAKFKGIPYLLIIGPQDLESNKVSLIDLEKDGSKVSISLDEVVKKLSSL